MSERKYKRIYCCGDCIQYKKHRCVFGAKDPGMPQDHFYADCPLPTYIETPETLDAVIEWIFEHNLLSEDFKRKFPMLAALYNEKRETPEGE